MWLHMRIAYNRLTERCLNSLYCFSFLILFLFQGQMQIKSDLLASNKTAQNSVAKLIKFIELAQSL